MYHSKYSLKAFLDEDLPNIFGINPIEAAIIIGALYYFYGPATLYEYARTAGNFVATYLPIAQQVSGDIFNEFKDYFEEDQERELLKKQGFDITDIPEDCPIFSRVSKYVHVHKWIDALQCGMKNDYFGRLEYQLKNEA